MNLSKISSIIQYVLLAASVVVFVLFYTNGTSEDTALSNQFVDYSLYWGYILFLIAAAAAVILSALNFVKSLIANPKSGIKAVGSIVVVAAIVGIAYVMSDGTKLYMPTYDGTDNVYGWLKFADTLFFTLYALLGLAIVSLIVTSVIKIFR